jgi:hypothetical protein
MVRIFKADCSSIIPNGSMKIDMTDSLNERFKAFIS